MPDDFAHRLLLSMRAVAHEVGHPSAHPRPLAGRRAALEARLTTIESSRVGERLATDAGAAGPAGDETRMMPART